MSGTRQGFTAGRRCDRRWYDRKHCERSACSKAQREERSPLSARARGQVLFVRAVRRGYAGDCTGPQVVCGRAVRLRKSHLERLRRSQLGHICDAQGQASREAGGACAQVLEGGEGRGGNGGQLAFLRQAVDAVEVVGVLK